MGLDGRHGLDADCVCHHILQQRVIRVPPVNCSAKVVSYDPLPDPISTLLGQYCYPVWIHNCNFYTTDMLLTYYRVQTTDDRRPKPKNPRLRTDD